MQQTVDSVSSSSSRTFLRIFLLLFDKEEVAVVVRLWQHLQAEGGDDRLRAGQEGQRGEVRSQGGG